MKGKLIIIEGTDCSGKETQANKLLEKLTNDGYKCKKFSFPNYDSPTGKIVGGPYLGKSYICEGWFPETAENVDPMVSSLYFGADRLYNISKIVKELNDGFLVILDRYTYSNMAHQGGKELDKAKRLKFYKWLEKLEFEMLKLPRGNIKIFLHMPYDAALMLREGRKECPDQLERSKEHLLNAEKAYLEIARIYNFETIECISNTGNITKESIKSPEIISNEVYNKVIEELKD